MIFVILLALLSESLTQPMGACKAGSFSRGETASVTCYFHEDVGKSLYHVYVTLSPFDSSNEVIDTEVLVCFKQLGESRSCRKASGYDWDNEISSNLTMQIPAVQARFAGRYSCQLVPPDGLQSKPCDLHVEGGDEQYTDRNGRSLAIIILGVFSAVLCVTLIALKIICVKKERCSCWWGFSDANRQADLTASL
ncbi:uncharacterized protein [Littorina saxatilis]|uniref:uncharacterized protein isoform X2 n=1 Tax=Littorina saxatilis TaxID=31220 RepID=UPI0038B65214